MFDLLLFFIILKKYGLHNVQPYQFIMFTYDPKICIFLKKMLFFFYFLRKHFKIHFDMQNLVLSFISYGQLGQRRTILQKNVNGHLYSGQSFNSEDVLLVFPPLVRIYVFLFNVLSTLPRDEDKARKAPFYQSMRSFTSLHPSHFHPCFSARLRNESRCLGRDVKELPGQGTRTCMPQLRPGAAKRITNKYFF